MSLNLNNGSNHRDYGATTSSTSAVIATLPDVNFSGFSPTEFMSLSEDIAHNINAVNSSWKQLEKILKAIGTPRDQQSMRDKVHNIHLKTNSRIEVTSKDLERLTSIVRRGDKQQKLQLEKLTNDFRSVVEKYSAVQYSLVAAMRQTYSQTQLSQMQDDSALSEQAELLQRQRDVQAGLQFEHDIMVIREREIKRIESDILDVNAIMLSINKIAQQQGEQVDRIETSIENAATEVELGRDELMKASERRQSYRRKILIILVIAVIIGLIVTGIIVGQLKG
ncbi:syntaxin-12 [Teleopsis dalmanni]|uniref:syntaxin-12 n=1 Tax=Teleopsis dalmanni TaxID=139649 RepID=UPI0018CD426A|nr:syntaxin-12 [Teleopsis dalmanni]XP_037938391.1 syntaxin-12 [Teleopsis dalmanni]